MTKFPAEKALTQAQPIHEAGELLPEGSQNVHGRMNVYGTYMHGIFDGEGIAVAVVEALARKKGLTPEEIKVVDFKTYKEKQYDLLAQHLRQHLDMQKIEKILEAGL